MEGTMLLWIVLGNIAGLLLSTLSDKVQVQEEDRVNVTVFYESLCPDSRRFILNQLVPTYRQLGNIMNVELFAYGKAKTIPRVDGNGYTFQCQHGYRECNGNKVLECGKKHVLNKETYLDFAACVMYAMYRNSPREECARRVGINEEILMECARGIEGEILHQKAGKIQHQMSPDLYYVPWILIDGKFSWSTLRAAERNLKGIICEAYKGEKPIQCQ